MRNHVCPWCRQSTTLGNPSLPPLPVACKKCCEVLEKGEQPPSTGWVYPSLTGAMQ